MRDIWKDRLTRKRSNSACPPTHINTQSSATYYYKWKIFEVTTLDQVSEYVPSLRPLESYFIWIISPKFPPPALETISSHPGISSISQSSRDNHRFDSNNMNFLLVPELFSGEWPENDDASGSEISILRTFWLVDISLALLLVDTSPSALWLACNIMRHKILIRNIAICRQRFCDT